MTRKNRKKQKEQRYRFDTSIRYIMPMLPEGEKNRIYQNEISNIPCNIEQNDRDAVRSFSPGYQDKWFEGQYFDWLLYTGYITKESNNEKQTNDL